MNAILCILLVPAEMQPMIQRRFATTASMAETTTRKEIPRVARLSTKDRVLKIKIRPKAPFRSWSSFFSCMRFFNGIAHEVSIVAFPSETSRAIRLVLSILLAHNTSITSIDSMISSLQTCARKNMHQYI